MYLVADNSPLDVVLDDGATYARWKSFPVSQLSHHGRSCCEIAQHWFRGMDFAKLNGSDIMSGPRWIRQRFGWGPSRWPLHWCHALDADAIDCGAHAALAHEAFEARGLKPLRSQIVQSCGSRAVDQWRLRWGAEDVSAHWLGDGYIYHEANALQVGADEVKLWDGSAGCWLNPGQTRGYGSVLAVRIMSSSPASVRNVRWGTHRLPLDRWHDVSA